MQLADHCHGLGVLSLTGAVSITNVSMCYLLQRMGPQLLQFSVEQCPLLSEPTLIAIVERCASLETLNFAGTGITADAIMTHLIKPDCLLKLTVLKVAYEVYLMLQILRNAVGNEQNEANTRRWLRVLQAKLL